MDIKPYGECYLKDPRVARIIYDKVMSYNVSYYIINAISIMPNHVHLLLNTSIQVQPEIGQQGTQFKYVDVAKWMQLIKGGSAFLINRHLRRTGKLWAKESYDHFVRHQNEGEYQRIKSYILDNPKKAGLEEQFSKPPFLYSTDDQE